MKLSESSASIYIYVVLVIMSCIFAGWSLTMPPLGVIDNSVLMFTAQLLILAVVTCLGLEIKGSLMKGEISISKDVDDDQ